MGQDFKEILENYKKTMMSDDELEGFDTISIIDEANPPLTMDSKKYRDSQKIIYKQHISDINAKELMALVNNTENYDSNSLSNYKSDIIKKCLNIYCGFNENPVEILVFSTKGLYEKDAFKNAIMDVLKSLYEENEKLVINAYKSILVDWNFDECLELVLKSIVELRINSLEKEIYTLLERNIRLRKDSAKALVSIGGKEYYEGMLNLFCSQKNITSEENAILREVLFYFAKRDDSNTTYIYKYYIKTNSYIENDINSILIASIRKNLSKLILDDVERKLRNDNIDSRVHSKIIRMLGRCNSDKKVIEILKNSLEYSHLNKRDVLIAIGQGDLKIQIEVLKNLNSSEQEKSNAIIALGKSAIENSELIPILDAASKKSEMLKIAVYSVKVERGYKDQIVMLFQYIINKNNDDELIYAAMNQVRRLRGLGDSDLNLNLLKVAQTLLENDDAIYVNRVIKVIEIFTKGIPTDAIGELFLNKLSLTQHKIVKHEILVFFTKEYNRFNRQLKNKIKNVVVECTKDSNVSEDAMKCLGAINKLVDSTPLININ